MALLPTGIRRMTTPVATPQPSPYKADAPATRESGNPGEAPPTSP